MPKYFMSAHALPHINLCGLEKTLRSLFRYTVVINISLAVLTLALVGMSLLSMNTSTSAGYKIKLLQEQQATLAEVNATLQAELANMQAMDAVAARVNALAFTKSAAVHYVASEKPTVAYLQ